jgi:hypothetical protein
VSIEGFFYASVVSVPLAYAHLWAIGRERRRVQDSDMALFIWAAALPTAAFLLLAPAESWDDDLLSVVRIGAFGLLALGSLLILVRMIWRSNEPPLWIGLGTLILGAGLAFIHPATLFIVPPFWCVFYAGATASIRRARRRRRTWICERCGYDIHGIRSRRCPECGRVAC